MDLPTGRVRNVERDYVDPRPRDRAIRDAYETTRNSYQQTPTTPISNPSYPTVDQQFADSYNEQGLQPSVGRVAPVTRNISVTRRNTTRVARNTLQASGATLQTAGLAAQVSGKGLRAAGAGTMRAGVALSGTGVGAIVGVPLAAVGAALQGAGIGVTAAGKATTGAGRQTKRFGRSLGKRKGALKSLEVTTSIKDKFKVTRVNIMIISMGGSLYMMIQLPAAVIATVFLGIMYMVGYFEDKLKGFTGEVIFNTVSYVTSGVVDFISKILGFDLLSIINPGTFFALAHLVAVLIGITTLIGAAVIYQTSLINCLWGEASGKKISAFILALAFYLLPVINLFPWALIWMFVVWKHPE